jgi:hypothetical protein|tara:strand:- start:1210 stop:1587 length:378 start_codon:yes stop_codon:yes gene_type:complete
MKTLLDNYKEGPYKDFGLAFDEYCHAYDGMATIGRKREGLGECPCKGCSTRMHTSESKLAVLYFDRDEGAALFSAVNDNFEEEGFSMRLLHCTYCDIGFDTMPALLETLKDLHSLPFDEEELWPT